MVTRSGAKQQSRDPWEPRCKVVKGWPVVVFRIVFVRALAHKLHQKVSINAFVVMQRDEIEIVEPEDRRDEQDRNHTDLPKAFRNIGGNSCGRRGRGRLVSNRSLLLPRFFLT